MKTVRLGSLQSQRVAAGLSVTALARKANVSDRTIVNLEALHPTIAGATSGSVDETTAQRLADALGVTLTTLGIVRL